MASIYGSHIDMSPAPAAGTYRRSAGTVHDQRQVSRTSRAESSGGNPVPGPGAGPGGRSGLVGGASGLAAACLEIPCSLVVPPGRHQSAPQSLGWARVCGTDNSGVWVLKGGARTYNLPGDLDDVGVVLCKDLRFHSAVPDVVLDMPVVVRVSNRASLWPCPQPPTTATTRWRLVKSTTAYGHRRRTGPGKLRTKLCGVLRVV